MSIQQVLATLSEALLDPTIGFSAAVESLAQPGGVVYRSDVALVPWRVPGRPVDTRTANLMIRPRAWRTTTMEGGRRDAIATVDVGYETFSADPDEIQQNVAVASAALAMVIDGLRDYSDRVGGTIVEFTDDLVYQFGEYEGPTSNGFLCTITLIERSTQ